MSFLPEELFPASTAEVEGEEEAENLDLMEISNPHTHTSTLTLSPMACKEREGTRGRICQQWGSVVYSLDGKQLIHSP